MTLRFVAVAAWLAIAVPFRTPADTGPPSDPIRLSVTHLDQDTLTLRLTGPIGERVVADWSSNLLSWTVIETNAFIESTLTLYLPRQSETTFYRARRFEPPEGCGTPVCGEEFSSVTCPVYGPPDYPTNRNAAIPTGATPMKSIRLLVHILDVDPDDDQGGNLATPLARVAEQMETINRDFRPHRIQFVWTAQVDRATRFRQLFSRAHAEEMMRAFAADSSTRYNVFVTDTPPGFLGFSTYPWLTNDLGQCLALTPEGSTVISPRRWGNEEVTLTHELGHALGLWHTHHGSETELTCPPCWERANGTDADRTGDRCSDTPPSPLDGNCNLLTAIDPCSRIAWPLAGVHNFMSAAPWCRGRFTPQQAGRMHAWIDYRLTGWLDTNTPASPSDLRVVANRFGEIELSWIDNSWNETGFLVERSTNGGVDFATIAVLPGDTAGFFDPRPYVGTSQYRVIATNANAGVRSYGTLPQAVTQAVTLAQLLYVDGASIAQPPDGTLLRPFFLVSHAYEVPLSPVIIRIQSGDYPETFVLSNKLLRLEPQGGRVRIGREP